MKREKLLKRSKQWESLQTLCLLQVTHPKWSTWQIAGVPQCHKGKLRRKHHRFGLWRRDVGHDGRSHSRIVRGRLAFGLRRIRWGTVWCAHRRYRGVRGRSDVSVTRTL